MEIAVRFENHDFVLKIFNVAQTHTTHTPWPLKSCIKKNLSTTSTKKRALTRGNKPLRKKSNPPILVPTPTPRDMKCPTCYHYILYVSLLSISPQETNTPRMVKEREINAIFDEKKKEFLSSL